MVLGPRTQLAELLDLLVTVIELLKQGFQDLSFEPLLPLKVRGGDAAANRIPEVN